MMLNIAYAVKCELRCYAERRAAYSTLYHSLISTTNAPISN